MEKSKNRAKGIIIALVVVAVILLVSAVAFSGILGPSATIQNTPTTSQTSSTTSQSVGPSTTAHSQSSSVVSQVSSGLVASDPLTSGNISDWTLSASGVASENSSGLYVNAPQTGNQWADSFAARSVGNAEVYHAVLTMPYSTITNGSFNMGLYVQAAQPVNYISCGVGVNNQGHYWQVVYGTGNISQANNYQVLNFSYNKPSLSQGCTIITNGANLLTVYIGSTMVYSNSSMNLAIPAPFNTYLEVEAINSTGESLQGIFSNFYASLNNTITLSGAPSGGIVKIAGSSIPLNATVGSNGVATITLPAYQEPQSGTIQVYDSSGKLVASTASSVTLWGGDTYSMG